MILQHSFFHFFVSIVCSAGAWARFWFSRQPSCTQNDPPRARATDVRVSGRALSSPRPVAWAATASTVHNPPSKLRSSPRQSVPPPIRPVTPPNSAYLAPNTHAEQSHSSPEQQHSSPEQPLPLAYLPRAVQYLPLTPDQVTPPSEQQTWTPSGAPRASRGSRAHGSCRHTCSASADEPRILHPLPRA